MPIRVCLSVLILALLGGCASDFQASSRRPQWSGWSFRHGGVVAASDSGVAQLRVEAALRRLAPEDRAPALEVRLLDSGEAGAWAWRDGTVFVTLGALNVMDDLELTAVLAHEIAHLQHRGPRLDRLEVELWADRAGAAALDRAGLDPRSMLRMLRKLSDGRREHGQGAISARAAALRRHLETRAG